MSALTITHDGTTGELIAHITELQRKALAYDELHSEVELMADHLEALFESNRRDSELSKRPEGKRYLSTKAVAYKIAADKVRGLL